MAPKKWYVVWQGRAPGIYETWQECKEQIEGFPMAKYKGYTSLEQAQEAYEDGYEAYVQNRYESSVMGGGQGRSTPLIKNNYEANSYSVDAACSGNPGPMEYRGVYTLSHTQLFHVGPMMGTNNIGEFLAIVHALAQQKQQGTSLPIYTDSRTALSWIKGGKCRTKLPLTKETERVYNLIARAEKWLEENPITIPILKWNTQEWGEIPADFGRK